MASTTILRLASRPASNLVRSSLTAAARPVALRSAVPSLTAVTGVRSYSEHSEETFEEFTARYEKEFDNVQDVFELQRNLNNSFAYDLVPSPSVVIAALKAARRVNDYPTAVRIFEGIKSKVENKAQYEQYLQELKGLREELGVDLVEELYPPKSKH